MPTQLTLLRRDLGRHFVLMSNPTAFDKLRLILGTEGVWYVISYRLARWARRDVRLPVVAQILKIFTALLHFALTVVTKIDISFDVEIGGGLFIGHSGYVIVNTSAVLGENCNLSPGVVIGEGGRGGSRGCPVIGNHVYFGPGAKVFGQISIADNVAIGANAVVNKSVPPNAVVAGNPGTVVSYRGATDFVVVEPAYQRLA